MQRNEHSIDVAAPPERVFELLSQPDSMRRWVGGLAEFRPIDQGPAEGSRAVQVVEVAGRRWEVQSRIEVYDPPRALESTLEHRAFGSRVAYRLEPRGGGTHVDAAIDTDLRGGGRLIGGLVKRQAQRKLEDDLDRLKRLAETPGS